ncbi:Small GTPase superfamily, ARF/SAR type like protein [Aduncisulcus paluster]|uniref:Small GTPase superfamily, ARF/SAR type like protein n=1 Tax=Aduncisulcus paluster TaxID=2918883 RepID=A0ABQ5KVU3_9EUKA|nr:Small GTPase superfamily, ARF/SAR type like protein [Aduncisulcus paluster]
MGLWARFVAWLKSVFFKKELELAIVGLDRVGKTTLVLAMSDEPQEDTIPTVGFNIKSVKKGSVQFKFWDLGGQSRFRSNWHRYCATGGAIVYVIDGAAPDRFALARQELHLLASQASLVDLPLLILANKNDLPDSINSVDKLKEVADHESLVRINKYRTIGYYCISALKGKNIEFVLKWLMDHAKS